MLHCQKNRLSACYGFDAPAPADFIPDTVPENSGLPDSRQERHEEQDAEQKETAVPAYHGDVPGHQGTQSGRSDGGKPEIEDCKRQQEAARVRHDEAEQGNGAHKGREKDNEGKNPQQHPLRGHTELEKENLPVYPGAPDAVFMVGSPGTEQPASSKVRLRTAMAPPHGSVRLARACMSRMKSTHMV